MRVLLVSANRERLPDPVAPLGLAYVAAALRDEGHQVQIVDLCFADDPEQALGESLQGAAADLVGFSLRNLDNVTYLEPISYLDDLAGYVRLTRSLTDVPIVLGGSGFTLLPHQILDRTEADFGVVGEGERAAVQLVRALESGKPTDDVAGVLEAGADPTAPTRPDRIPDLSSLAEPARDLLDNEAYLRLGGAANLQTKRGCPLRCVYCTYPLIEGQQVRTRPAGAVADELEELVRDYAARHVFLVDNTFNVPIGHAKGVCEEIIRRGLSVEWSCYAQPGEFDRELVELMSRAGCRGVEFGIDAACEPMLRAYRKPFGVEDVERVVGWCAEIGVPACLSLLLGGPGETLATVRESLAVVERMDVTAVNLMVGVRVYPGTRLWADALEEGLLTHHTDPLQPTFYLAAEVHQDILEVVLDGAARNRNWIVPGRGVNVNERVQRKIRGYGFHGPLWGYFDRVLRRGPKTRQG